MTGRDLYTTGLPGGRPTGRHWPAWRIFLWTTWTTAAVLAVALGSAIAGAAWWPLAVAIGMGLVVGKLAALALVGVLRLARRRRRRRPTRVR